jgi:hypothetical protein
LSDLELLLKRRKREENQQKSDDSIAKREERAEKTVELKAQVSESRGETIDRKKEEGGVNSLEAKQESKESRAESLEIREGVPVRAETRVPVEESAVRSDDSRVGSAQASGTAEGRVENAERVKAIMEGFANRDPKIGVWSYPAFLVLQYLFHTVPGFRMSRVAKEALERGLREMYPELFSVAEEVSRKIYEQKGITPPS